MVVVPPFFYCLPTPLTPRVWEPELTSAKNYWRFTGELLAQIEQTGGKQRMNLVTVRIVEILFLLNEKSRLPPISAKSADSPNH